MSLLRVKYIAGKRRTLSPAYVWVVTVLLITLAASQHRHASEESYRCQTVNSNLGRHLINTQTDGDEHSHIGRRR